MSDKLICPNDGLECIYPEQHEDVSWNGLKIQELLEKTKEVDWGGEEQTQ